MGAHAGLVLVVVVGCGRVGFDPSVSDAQSGSDALPSFGPFGAFGSPIELTNLSTPQGEVAPVISSDDRELYWASLRAGIDHTLWYATRATTGQPWSCATWVPLVSSTGALTEPMLSGDGLLLAFDDYIDVFASTRSAPGAAWGAISLVPDLNPDYRAPDLAVEDTRMVAFSPADNDLYEWRRPSRTAPWGSPQRIDELSTPDEESFPSLRSDGLEILFNSDRDGRGLIYRALRPALDQPFGAPSLVTIDPALDALSEADPDLSADGTTLYFVVAAAGDTDLYVATRTPL